MKWIVLVFLFAMDSMAEINAYVFGSLGEAPFRNASDLNEMAIIPQAGFELEYRLKYAAPYFKTSIGRYNHGALYEGYLGLRLGMNFQWIRPSFLVGAGVQSANFKTFTGFDSDTYSIQKRVYTPFGIGCRAEVAKKVYAELDSRFNGYPWWKFELGYRIKTLGQVSGS